MRDEGAVRDSDAFHEEVHMSIPYRPGVGIVLLNPKREIFIAQRIDQTSDAWQMPQGGIHLGEEPKDAVLRELREETGLASDVAIVREAPQWFFYDFPEELAAKLWKGKYRGQRQKWFAMQFTGQDRAINIKTHHPEFSEWKWASPDEVVERIVPFKRQLYQTVLNEFQELLK